MLSFHSRIFGIPYAFFFVIIATIFWALAAFYANIKLLPPKQLFTRSSRFNRSRTNPTVNRRFDGYHSFDISPARVISSTVNSSMDINNFTYRAIHTAVCFMSPLFDRATYDFARNLAMSPTIAVFILVDSVDVDSVSLTDEGIHLVSLSTSVGMHGFRLTDGFNVRKEVHTWDKALFFFGRIANQYEFVWLIEYDVLILSNASFYAVHRQAIETDADLVSAHSFENLDGHVYKQGNSASSNPLRWLPSIVDKKLDWDWHWQRIKGRMELPWYGSMMCATGISSRLLQKVSQYADKNGRLEFIEIFLITLAKQNNLTVLNPSEMATIHFRNEWTCTDILANKRNWFHPVKEREKVASCLSE